MIKMSNEFKMIPVPDDYEIDPDRLKGLSSKVVMGFKHENNAATEVVECAVNLLNNVVMRLSNEKVSYGSRKTKNGLDTEMVYALKMISGALVHMINSTSWINGELYCFDTIELSNRLEHAAILMRRAASNKSKEEGERDENEQG